MHLTPCDNPWWRAGHLALAGAAVLLGLVACAGPSGPARGLSSPSGASSGPQDAAPSPLAAESTWLKTLFEGTPVQIVDQPDGAVLLTVPLTYAFDAPGAVAKPPLKAVLDKLAMSLLRQPAARLQVAVPGPAAAQRLQAMRRQLAGAGVAGWRVATLASSREDAVQLRLLPGVAARRQVDEPAAAERPGPR